MSLFPAYNASNSANPEEGSKIQNDNWLENKSYQESKVKSRSRSNSPERRRRSRSPKKHRRRSRSRSPGKHRRRSRSRSRSRRRRSRTPKKKRRKRSSKSPEATREELIVKFSANKTFLEDIDVAPEHAFRRDKARDRSLLTVSTLPISVTSSYSKNWKRDYDELCNFYHLFKPPIQRSKRSKRYFGKEFQLSFNKADLLQNLTDLSPCLNKEKQIEFRSFYRIVREIETNDENSKEELNDDLNDIKLHKIQLQTKEFNQQLRRTPHDVDLWLKYVDFQEVALADSEFVIGKDNENETATKKKKNKNASVMVRSKAIVEKKLSILKSALDHNPKSVILSVQRLNLSKEILDSNTLNRQWKELIFLFPTDVQVWDSYLTFLTSHFTTFTVSQITNAFKDCFSRLQEMVGQAFRSDHEDLEEQMSGLLVRLWHLWARAGYREKSVALFQALIEINLNAPAFPGYFSSQDRLATFEPFWEASVPRFGEKKALGWAKFAKEHVMEEDNCIGNLEEEDHLVAEFGGKVDNVQLWLKLELLREAQHYLPYRVTQDDEDEVEDSDRIILYDQLEGLLYQFQDPCQVFKLYLSFFHFLGLDLYYEDSIELGLLGTQAFHDWVGSNHPQIHDIDDPNDGTLMGVNPGKKAYAAFVHCLLEQGIAAFAEPFRTQIILLWLKYECDNLNESLEVSKAKKSKAKELKGRTMQFLQEDQHNSRVYISYALALNKLEGYKSAKKVLDMALLSQKKAFDKDHIMVFSHAANLELKAGQSDNALWIWALMAHKRPFEPCNLNKPQLLAFASQGQAEFRQELKSLHDAENATMMLKSVPCMPNSQLLAFLSGLWGITYILEGPVALQKSFRDVLQNIKMAPALKDVCYKIKHDLLLENHVSATKETILEWLTEFPHSHNALRRLRNINVQTSCSSAFWRSLQAALTSKLTSPVGHLAVIKLLTHQFKVQNSQEEMDQMGHLFKAWRWLNEMVQKEPCRTCPQAWRLLMWTSHMLSQKNPFRYQAKTIFYRALQDNPSAKVLGLDLLQYQGDAKLQAEIQDIFAEKEVRIRLPMEELQVLLEAEEDLDENL